MEPFPPELIAQIATRIFREGAHRSEPSPPNNMSASPVSSALFRERLPTQPEVSGYPMIPEIPGSHSSPSSIPSPLPAGSITNVHAPHSFVTEAPSAITHTPSAATEATHTSVRTKTIPRRVSATPADGLQGFVQGVRSQSAVGREDCLGGEQNRFTSQANPAAKNMAPLPPAGPLNVNSVRADFPVLHQRVHGFPLAWLDNAATTQKPQVVIDAISHFYAHDNSNIHRAAHSLAARATEAYESARKTVAAFLGARSEKDIVFARGTTEAINLVANTYGARYLKKGDEILLSMVEHHANIVPWQMVAKRKGAVIRVIPINDRGEIIMDEYVRLLSPRTRIVSLTHASNSLGTILPVAEMTALAKSYGARVLIDGAQSVSHMPINVQALNCDFFVFSGHKIFGPTGIGALYVSDELHDVLPPWQGGGNMIKNVTFEKTTYAEAPAKFEAGTPNIADAVGLRVALEYVQRLGLSNIAAHEHSLTEYATRNSYRSQVCVSLVQPRRR